MGEDDWEEMAEFVLPTGTVKSFWNTLTAYQKVRDLLRDEPVRYQANLRQIIKEWRYG